METYDCVVVGTGCHGLAAARQYRFTHPNHSLRVFGPEATIGGTWATERLYPDLRTNNLLGTFEYPDFPMDQERFDVKPGRPIPGAAMHAYLEAFAAEFGLKELIRFRTKVAVAEHLEGESNPDGGWILTVIDLDTEGSGRGEQSFKVHARRLIVASGLTSEPRMPRFEGEEQFGGRVFHTKTFKQNSDTLKTLKSITILGSNKSAWDAVYAYANSGVQVNWVLRSTGHGPAWTFPPFVTPFKKWFEGIAHTRFITWLSPCIWADGGGFDWIRRFLHGTWVGRLFVDLFWDLVANDLLSHNRYDSHPKTALLKPRYHFAFASAQASVLNYDTNFFELVKSDKVDIHVAEIDRLSPGKVHLSNGTWFESEAIMANSGWKQVPPITFLPEGIEAELGLPHQQATLALPDDLGNRADLLDRADREILERFPRLIQQPRVDRRGFDPSWEKREEIIDDEPLTMPMMYRFMIPASTRFLRHRDIAFCGLAMSLRTMTGAHLQGLWISSYFAARLANDPSQVVGSEEATESLQYETVLHNRFCRWRYPTDHRHPSLALDGISYFDMLMRDMGLNARRKHDQGIFAEISSPYWPKDHSHVNDEWERHHQAHGEIPIVSLVPDD